MRKIFISFISTLPLVLLAIYGHGNKSTGNDQLIRELEYSLEKDVETGAKAIIQRDSLNKITTLATDSAFLNRFRRTQVELSRQAKQLDILRTLVLREK